MEQRLVCDTVRDLLPMYIDGMTSEVSNKSIEGHMESCRECRDALEQMRRPVGVDVAPEVKEFKKFLKKSKMDLFYWIMGAAALIAVVTCFIVNLAVDKELSWFYIVCAGIVTAYFPAYVLIASSKRRFEAALAALSVCVVILVGTVQIVLHYFMEIGGIWFWEIALPVMALWIAIPWIGVICHERFHVNVLLSLAVVSFLTVPGNYLTHILTGDYRGVQDAYDRFLYDGLGNGLLAVTLLAAGIIVQIRKGKKEDGK